jgi:hypothetical protein
MYLNIPTDWNCVLKCSYWLKSLCWNIPTDWQYGTKISLLTVIFVLKYPYWLHIMYLNIPTDWQVGTKISLLTKKCCTEYIPAVSTYFSELERPNPVSRAAAVGQSASHPQRLVSAGPEYLLYWNVPTDWKFERPYWLHSLHWHMPYWLDILYWPIPTDRHLFCTGISVLTVYFVLGYSYCLDTIVLEHP